MSFTVSAGTQSRLYSWQHGSMMSALEQGLALTTTGMSDVRIVDSEGRSHSPAALYQRLFGPRPAATETAPVHAHAA